MRSQATKPVAKKAAFNKTTLKADSPTRLVKKKAAISKTAKSLVKKSLVKNSKKSGKKDDSSGCKTDEDSSTGSNLESFPNTSKASTSKSSPMRSESPSKKAKTDHKEKIELKSSAPPIKKTVNTFKKVKPISKSNIKNIEQCSDDIKYKLNSEGVKKEALKTAKGKNIVKKGIITNKKITSTKHDNVDAEDQQNIKMKQVVTGSSISDLNCAPQGDLKFKVMDLNVGENMSDKSDNPGKKNLSPSTSSVSRLSQSETVKPEIERPPKFFTSSRSPRTVETIDVKCSNTSKGKLNVSERFISIKLDESIKEKTATSNTFLSQGPEIDVYTFTEKVDSPKSILSDFRNPTIKNVGRVRPIARVKGTIIDKKMDGERKKYSPHRPIEEVVEQLKANKKNEELKSRLTQNIETNLYLDLGLVHDEKEEESANTIISKSYKKVARKSSIPGKPFSPIKFLDNDETQQTKSSKEVKTTSPLKKTTKKLKIKSQKNITSDDELDNSRFSFNTKSKSSNYSSSEESINDSHDENDTKESSGSDTNKVKLTKKAKKYKRITDSAKKTTSKELKELSKDSLIDLKDESVLLGHEKPSKRRLKLLSMWTGPKKHRMASLNAIAKVHCLYENESRTHMELGLMKTVDRLVIPNSTKPSTSKKKEPKHKEPQEKQDTTSESEYERKDKKEDSSEDDSNPPNTRTLRGVPGIRSAGKYWDPKSSTSSSEESELEYKKKVFQEKKKVPLKTPSLKSDSDKPPQKMKKTAGVPVKKKRNRNEVVMDLKDMVVQKRMASLNATAILAASYEKRSPKSSKDETTSDSCSDESFSQKSKNGVASGVKSETKVEDTKKESEELSGERKQKVQLRVNQESDVTITGVYSTHHEGFCTVSGMQYRISSTSHTQTTATANCDKECSREDGARYTPLSALSSMQPPAEHAHTQPHPVPELSGLTRRTAGCSSAFSAPSPAAHHEPGYYQPAGPLIKESGGADAERALARYHPPPHYHAPHPTVLQQYGPPYYPTGTCYGRYYGPPGPYHMPPPSQSDSQVGVGSDPYPPPQYYGAPPCYQHSPQRVPYIEYRGCPCPMNACPKNVLIGPATGKAPAGGGPDVSSALAPPRGAFGVKARACALDAGADTHGSGKDPPLEAEPPAAADAPRPCLLPAIGGASPKRELYDVRDNLRLVGDMSGPAEAVGPPSPARGSAGACAPQPPPVAPRRARLGKAMVRRSLAGDDTGLLLSAPQVPQANHSDVDDDVLAISPPVCLPIDLSSSDETDRRSAPLVDVKKENEGPTYSPMRKTDAQALKEHNCSVTETTETTNAAKAVKRRYSKPKMEIELRDVELEDGCKTNGIGEHVKLQKRRKVSSEQNDISNRMETVTKETKKKPSPKVKRTNKSTPIDKKNLKRKLENDLDIIQNKKILSNEDVRLNNIIALPQDIATTKPKTKSALLLDNLLRKNSIDRPDAKSFTSDSELDPVELFLSPKDNSPQNCTKKSLNINNNVIENNVSANGVRPNTIAAVSQLLGKKLESKKFLKKQKIESKVTNNIKPVNSVLKTPTEKVGFKESNKLFSNEQTGENKSMYAAIHKNVQTKPDVLPASEDTVSKNPIEIQERLDIEPKQTVIEPSKPKAVIENIIPEKISMKRSKLSIDKLNGELKSKNLEKTSNEKVAKLLVSKKSVIKTDEAALLVEDACASPIPMAKSAVRRARRRRSGPKRSRRVPALLPPPASDEARAPPRWSNGWRWDGEHSISKVYLNNDSRQDLTARCWTRMSHASGDRVARGDCVLLKASATRAQPFVARVARLWENPLDGEMMVSLVWYYRPEHTQGGRQAGDAPDEVFASRHRDANSVACIEDKCYVLTFNEYCRYRKRLKAAEEGIRIKPSIVPPMPANEVVPAIATNDSRLPPSVSPELVLFCRKIYDFRSKKIQVPNK